METAEHFDQAILHPVDFRYRKIIRHLLGETLQQVTVTSNRLLKGIHHLGTDQVLGWNYIVQIEAERLLENMPFGLPILLSDRDKFVVKLGINFRSELLSRRVWHGLQSAFSPSFYLLDLVDQDKSLFIHPIDNTEVFMLDLFISICQKSVP
jgi:hypothetical protein